MRLLLGVTLVVSLGCAARETPYRFRGAVGGVDLRPVARPAARSEHAGRRVDESPRASARARIRERIAPHAVDPGAACGTPECYVVEPVGLLSEVGKETSEAHHAFALRVAERMGVTLRDELRQATTGEELVERARARGAVDTEGKPLVGDLVVFSDGWLVGVVAGTTPAGAIEFLYVQRGRVMRGYVTPARPSEKRDAEGRVLNTFVRPQHPTDTRQTRHLAGDAFTGFIHLDGIAA